MRELLFLHRFVLPLPLGSDLVTFSSAAPLLAFTTIRYCKKACIPNQACFLYQIKFCSFCSHITVTLPCLIFVVFKFYIKLYLKLTIIKITIYLYLCICNNEYHSWKSLTSAGVNTICCSTNIAESSKRYLMWVQASMAWLIMNFAVWIWL